MLAAALSLLIVSAAPAATRYAAPGGTGKDPCARPAKPCSVYTAADENAPRTTIKAGDVVELAPGTYRAEEEGEFGYIPPVSLPEGVTVRGEPGKASPVIVLPADEFADSAFYVPTAAEVADVEIRNLMDTASAINVSGGTMDQVIARSTASSEPTCNFLAGTISSSACISSGGGPAIGVNVASKGTFEGVIRNSTLVATGPGSVGMEFIYHAFKRGMTVNVDAVGVLVEGEEKDVVAWALPLNKGRGANVSIKLRNSSFKTVETVAEAGGRASVTRPGIDGNITAPPLLAADNLHQLPESPTIDRGALDGASGILDIDEEPRAVGGVADIGADELGPTAPRVNPAPDTKLADYANPEELLYEQTPKRTAEFNFGSSEPGSRYECKLDRKPYRVCTSPYRKKVKLGKHRFQVRAIDPQGKIDRTPAVFRWRVLPRRFREAHLFVGVGGWPSTPLGRRSNRSECGA